MNSNLLLALAQSKAKDYTDETAIAFGGLKGASCQISKIEYNEDGDTVITFLWENNDGQVRTSKATVKKGTQGVAGTTYVPVVDKVTTLEPTQKASATVVIDEETKTAKFSFAIPRGKNGGSGGYDDTELWEAIDGINATLEKKADSDKVDDYLKYATTSDIKKLFDK